MGDVIHNFPVVTDLLRAFPHIEIDWITEAPYVELARLHPGVKDVFPLHLRAAKANWFSPSAWRTLATDKAALAGRRYDAVLDTQGLVKSALIARWVTGANAPVIGYSRAVAREPMAARFYQRAFDIARDQHAVARNRALAAAAFGYSLTTAVDYGIVAPRHTAWQTLPAPYAVLLHATSRADKQWPHAHWIALGKWLSANGLLAVLPWGNAAEKSISEELAKEIPNALVPPSLPLAAAAAMLAGATRVVGVDTGLAHLAVALGRPTIGLFITTRPAATGLYGGGGAVNLGGGTAQSPSTPSVADVVAAMQLDHIKNRVHA